MKFNYKERQIEIELVIAETEVGRNGMEQILKILRKFSKFYCLDHAYYKHVTESSDLRKISSPPKNLVLFLLKISTNWMSVTYIRKTMEIGIRFIQCQLAIFVNHV